MDKISIIGSGRVGEAAAHLLAQKSLAKEVMLIDVRPGIAEGVALDIQECAPLFGFDTRLRGSTELIDIADSDVVVITAGKPRQPGMSRMDVLGENNKILLAIAKGIKQFAPNAIVIVVSNPVDILTYQLWRHTGFDKQRVIGQAGVLDAARMASFVALETGFSVQDINTMVLGGHGDAMVPMTRYTCINGIPIAHFLDEEVIEKIVKRTREGGAEILALKQTSSAYDAPGAAIVEMIEAIHYDRKRLLPCVALLDGEYGHKDIAAGVPVVLGANGAEKIVELDLEPTEAQALDKSLSQLREDLATLAENN
ncbi:MAG: malate dehydrogenase [Gammaproteobacteria bacterium]|nr:malate dehydrogenase [Gammaproteobacteria bacterium]